MWPTAWVRNWHFKSCPYSSNTTDAPADALRRKKKMSIMFHVHTVHCCRHSRARKKSRWLSRLIDDITNFWHLDLGLISKCYIKLFGWLKLVISGSYLVRLVHFSSKCKLAAQLSQLVTNNNLCWPFLIAGGVALLRVDFKPGLGSGYLQILF